MYREPYASYMRRVVRAQRKEQRAREKRAPYGVSALNGLNFKKSLSDPNSRLARTVNYIRKNGPTGRRKINLMLGMNPKITSRGWGTFFLTTAVKADLLKMVRDDTDRRKVLYALGTNAKDVV